MNILLEYIIVGGLNYHRDSYKSLFSLDYDDLPLLLLNVVMKKLLVHPRALELEVISASLVGPVVTMTRAIAPLFASESVGSQIAVVKGLTGPALTNWSLLTVHWR